MNASRHESLDRIFAPRELLRGRGLTCLLVSIVGALLFGALLFDLYLIGDLLATRGRIDSRKDALVRAAQRRLVAASVPNGAETEKAPADATHPAAEDPPAPKAPPDAAPNAGRRAPSGHPGALFEDRGLAPTVAWSLDKPWGRPLLRLYDRVEMLQTNHGALVLLVVTGVLLGALHSLCLARASVLAQRLSLDAVTQLRRDLHRQTLRLGPGELDDQRANEQVLALFSVETERVRDGLAQWIRRVCWNPALIVVLLLLAVAVDWRVSLQCLIPLGLCWWLVQRGRKRFAVLKDLAEARAESELRILAESFRKTRLVRAFGMESFEHDQYQKHLDRFREKLLAAERSDLFWRWVNRGLVTIFVGLVVMVVGSKVLQSPDELTVAAAVLLVATFGAMYRPLSSAWELSNVRGATAQAADRIQRYLNQIPSVGQAVGAKFLQPLAQSLQFENVTCVRSDGRPLLDRLNLKIPAGQMVAVVSLDPLAARGFAYLLPRFLEPKDGRILIDGEDIAWVTLESLRAEAIFIGGTDPFFTGTVAENVHCGGAGYSLQAVTEAAKLAHAHNFILRLPQGYETVLGEHGEQLDAGQAFRLGLARAILRKPALLVVEEPAEALDEDTKNLLDDAYNRLAAGRTVVFLPSRLSTLRRADRIVLLHEGKIAADGPYADLVRTSQLYRHWEYLRFNQFRGDDGAAT